MACRLPYTLTVHGIVSASAFYVSRDGVSVSSRVAGRARFGGGVLLTLCAFMDPERRALRVKAKSTDTALCHQNAE